MAAFAEFGPLVIETDVDVAVVELLRLWLPTHLAQVERERGLANRLLARPRHESFANVLEDDEFPEGRLPSILVTTAQTEGDPEVDGDGSYYAAWSVTVSAVVRGRTPAEARAVGSLFGGAIKRIMVQQELTLAGEVKWRRGSLAPVADLTAESRHLAASINTFTVYTDHVLQQAAGPVPASPDYPDHAPDPVNQPDEPYDPLVQVTQVTVGVEGAPITARPGG